MHRISSTRGFTPLLVRILQISSGLHHVEPPIDAVVLYRNSPHKATPSCMDGKSHFHALRRTGPGLPLKKKRAATISHDHKHTCTTTPYAVLNVPDGQPIGECLGRHRQAESLPFLRRPPHPSPSGFTATQTLRTPPPTCTPSLSRYSATTAAAACIPLPPQALGSIRWISRPTICTTGPSVAASSTPFTCWWPSASPTSPPQ